MWGQVNRRFTTTDKTQCAHSRLVFQILKFQLLRIPIAWAWAVGVGPNMNRNNQTKRQR